MYKKKEVFFALLVPVIFVFFALFTIGDYGVNIDEAAHFRRGQGYLHYFLTGKKDYKNLPLDYKRSYYQTDAEPGRIYLDAVKEQSHPPLNDTLAALTNYIFYQKLGILGDVEAHHLFGLISVTLMIFFIYVFTRVHYGIFAGLIAALAISLYPIFWAESHFNVKDPPQASFFAITVILLWFGITRKKAKYILFSAVSCAFALGTKFNIVFLPFIMAPWFLSFGKKILKFPKRIYYAFIVFPIIVIGIFFVTNPNLWNDTVFRLENMVKFYLSSATKIGGSVDYQPEYLIFGFNTYPALAVLYSTPLVILLFFLAGFFTCAYRFLQKKDKTSLLLIVWFLFPLVRMSVPGATIYGGIRHIFEFIPAMAIVTGFGASVVALWLHAHFKKSFYGVFRKNLLIYIFIILLFVPLTIKIIMIHPNENVYFNPLIGGLKGAKDKLFPYAGISVGNTYLQGARWLNLHAEKNACITTPLAHLGVLPPDALRKDLAHNNTCQSGLVRKGEYSMDMVYTGYFNDLYAYAYLTGYLNPVYEIRVDNVVIFQVFKNDRAHSKKQLIKKEIIEPVDLVQEKNKFQVTLPKITTLGEFNLLYDIPASCKPIADGYVLLSKDGNNWEREPDNINVSLGTELFRSFHKRIERKFAAKKTKYIQLITDLEKDCKIEIKKIEIFHHPDANE